VIDPNEKGVITRTQAVCRGSPKSFVISEQIISNLSAKTIESLHRLEKYEIPSGVIERIKPKDPFDKMTDAQIREIVNEFKKFMAIVVMNHKTDNRVEMVSELVDEVWHTFILFTNEYKKFCNTLVGEYIHHEPNVDSLYGIDPLFPYKKKQSTEFFYEEYERCFGPLPEIWNVIKSPSINVTNKEEKETKNILAIIYTSLSFVIPTFLIWQYQLNMFYALVEAIILGIVFVIINVVVVTRIKEQAINDSIFKGTAVVGTIILFHITIIWYICFDIIAILFLNIFGILGLHAAFGSNGKGKKATHSGGGGILGGCGSMSGDGEGGGGCCGGAGGCGGGGGCGG
jgi:hypothetical protein